MTWSGIWITGEPASGKTTLARRLARLIPSASLLDGDEVRQTLTADCDFSAQGRRTHVLRVAAAARKVREEGRLPIVALVSPTEVVRQAAYTILGPSPLVIALEAPLEVREQRAQAAGRPLDPALDFPYEPSPAPTISLDTSCPPQPLELACAIVLRLLAAPPTILQQRWVHLHHRCASSWWRGVLCHLPASLVLHGGLNWYGDPPTRREVADLKGYAVVPGGNARWETLAHLDALYGRAWRSIHVYRDPRDLLVSAYYSHRYSHPEELLPELERYRPRLHTVSVEDGLLLDLEFYLTKLAIETILDWPDHPRVLPIPYEQMFRSESSVRAWTALALRWLQIEAPDVEGYLQTHTFDQLAQGRVRGREDSHSHYHRGTPGAWREAFTPRVAEIFSARYGVQLAALGYEEEEGQR